MPLAAGTRLAHYEIIEPIGKGGMGQPGNGCPAVAGRPPCLGPEPAQYEIEPIVKAGWGNLAMVA